MADGAEENRADNAIRLGVIGAGWFASRRHLPDAVAHPQIVLTALCRRDPDARARLADHFGVAPENTFGDWRQMLDTVALDAVLITTPNYLHFEPAREALERGLHVLIEKPMTIRSADARALVALAQARNRRLAVALNPPFWAHCHRIRRALGSVAMGGLESASMYWTGSAAYLFGRAAPPEALPGLVPPTPFRADPAQNGGGYLIDGGSHLISELLWVTGLRARRVTALLDAIPTDMRASLSIELSNGAVASLTTIGDSQLPVRRVRHVFGAEHGTVIVIGFEFETSINLHGQETQKFRESDLAPVASPIANFAEAIQGQAELASPGEHGSHVVEVVEAAYESATTGRTVSIPEPSAGNAAIVASEGSRLEMKQVS
ncbi:MAG TPA: Gfo/Idh/MocA family oxidoreductase [Chthonomonadaceae bacterium]|nr:Gfo/Idh/MocA family oxidoreductase [Chthonomonadaceae bacterium]